MTTVPYRSGKLSITATPETVSTIMVNNSKIRSMKSGNLEIIEISVSDKFINTIDVSFVCHAYNVDKHVLFWKGRLNKFLSILGCDRIIHISMSLGE